MPGDAFRALGIEPPVDPALLAIGWATVELDRAARELGAAFGVVFIDVPGSSHLGCACRVSAVEVDGVHIALLEPSTEGRLARSLARHGEGWVATWTRQRAVAGDATPRLSGPQPGPFGSERLVRGGATSGPHRLLVEAATIRVP